MGGATIRFFTLLSSPLPLLHPRRPSSLLLLRIRRLAFHRSSLFHSPLPLHFLSPPKCSQQLHTHHAQPLWDETPSVNSNGFSISASDYHHQWPEFLGFVNWVLQSGYGSAPFDVSQFVGAQQLDENFLRGANSCLAFARAFPTLLWSLPKEDIEVVVNNGSPFLFANASAAAARMNIFLGDGIDNVLDSDKPSTVDLMEFLLSYAHMAENKQICSSVESTVRKLFSELAKSKGSSVEPLATGQKQLSERYEKASRSPGKNLEMKKGDWICQRCSFMNYAKNSQCLECKEHRPQKLLTGGEWECPQCDFCNFGRNVVCLRCDCKKPAVDRFLRPTSVSSLRGDTSSVKGNTEELITGTEEEQQWFTKISQLEKSSDMSSALTDEDLPETMKARDNKFTWSAASTKTSGTIDNPGQSYSQTAGDENSIHTKISQSLEELTGEKSFPYRNRDDNFGKNSRTSSPSAMSSSASSQYGQHSELKSYAPVQQQTDEKSPNQMGNKDYEREQAEKSERWFKKGAEMHDVNDLPSAISDDDFPEIMPMRKGENRFVVSKKKDRSLTSPMYKRRAAMEQASNNNYVPFVPFPPDYFAKDRSQEGSQSTQLNEQTGATRSDSGGQGERMEDKFSKPVFEVSNNVDQKPTIDSQFSSPSKHSESQSTSKDSNFNDSWRERSLEGSAVKESDPLDMSEEAKAERWFRRVAQIKDISELSQIPDEDFPSIMPMRKGVNRFVVSKRKTPLERRLTSSQYKRNLPVVSSDPVRKETDSN
ncbi:zinc finger protein VAR3, chloroplastic [Spinacia oleracea]|uniref:Zinc finger protein VAR3, chloroplastic n=1 Tax=Spinacia oleracea TaxID=3562 RepID=A0A9R0KC48_SPIOL|nr:zinc finger protein VAR3, chloroplastic [Spinacia oleracea]